MALHRSLDDSKFIAALLHDVRTSVEAVFNYSSLEKDLKKVCSRLSSEGTSFLTKTLPRLGKAFDKALSGGTPLNASQLRFSPQPGSKLPKMFGELFNRVLHKDGTLLQEPSTECVRVLRQICFVFYKYELPYTDEQEQQVVAKFTKTEHDLSTVIDVLDNIRGICENATTSSVRRTKNPSSQLAVAREAKILLSRLFASFDPKNIFPRHGPGAVATKQQLWDKYLWTNVSAKITRSYPLDEYFYSSLGHVCDSYKDFASLGVEDLPARVILVPKDSRGPRLISCEPVDYQWIQQGLGRAIVELAEHHELTKFNVFFTDQVPNRVGALLGSSTGRYATLDLNEASDRVSLSLVRLLFPPHIYEFLANSRSSSTVLPDGMIMPLEKFAPMGSCLCFPIMALTIWAILTVTAPDADARESIHVYGDDVIVTSAQAEDAMKQLESFGLKINRDKSCTGGLFRESCGMDAFKGIEVTPVRLRTVWSASRSPESYTSWIAYANSFYDKRYYRVYDYIVELLGSVYGPIPEKRLNLSVPSLRSVPDEWKPLRKRWNLGLQKTQFLVFDVKSPTVNAPDLGWSGLLRYFAEKANRLNAHKFERNGSNLLLILINGEPVLVPETHQGLSSDSSDEEAFSVSSYTQRRTSMLVRRWR